jgi:hypothetical protein
MLKDGQMMGWEEAVGGGGLSEGNIPKYVRQCREKL